MARDVEVRTLDGEVTRLPSEAIQDLRARLGGQVLTAEDGGYDDARRIWNGMIDRRPAIVARCADAADVARAVRFAREHRLLSSARGGGHNVAGLAACDRGLVIDLSPMKGIEVDPGARLARVQAGCLLGEVDRATQAHGLAAVLGFVSETGVAGLTVGGGFGYLTRRAGWTCDNVRSMEVVTADGEVKRASARENPDLFWCLRGGGGNFGIVTSFQYELHVAGPVVVAGGVVWRGEDAPSVLQHFREVAAAAPRELTCFAILRKAPPAPWLPPAMHGKPIAGIFACHTGRPEDGARAVASIKASGTPVADILVERPYVQMQTLFDAANPKGRRYYWKSEYVAGLAPGLLEVAAEHAARIPSPHSAIILFQIEGALNELPEDHSPAGNRDAHFVVNVPGAWERAEDDAVNLDWVRETWEAVKPFSTGGAYLNFQSEDEGADRVVAAYGRTNLARLAALKRRFDPEDLFRHTRRIG